MKPKRGNDKQKPLILSMPVTIGYDIYWKTGKQFPRNAREN